MYNTSTILTEVEVQFQNFSWESPVSIALLSVSVCMFSIALLILGRVFLCGTATIQFCQAVFGVFAGLYNCLFGKRQSSGVYKAGVCV